MPALILIVPLIAAYFDQTGRIPAVPLHDKAHIEARAPISYALPDKTEVIYFVAY